MNKSKYGVLTQTFVDHLDKNYTPRKLAKDDCLIIEAVGFTRAFKLLGELGDDKELVEVATSRESMYMAMIAISVASRVKSERGALDILDELLDDIKDILGDDFKE